MYGAARQRPRGLRLLSLHDHPGGGKIIGLWDLRQTVDDYLGRIDFAGKRVLEIGPASGFLTIEMERRGADVVAVELPEGIG